ncbi:hypothetical protein B7494_g2584 [Chlorociboria aeruginascens]|nr:hypothetical protein B7494_g2584 [Chlorociboria aeruginascens]
MRLLNTRDIVVESFPSPERPDIPDYAILSHRWGNQEISLQDIQNLTPELKNTEGYKKIERCCKEATSVGWEWVWIDTCCIDKTDQVELTEALNSMFHWYRRAQVCYSYMSDVPSTEDPRAKNSMFRKSKWFTRGWTLQELIAPQYLTFFGSDWKEVGTKSSLQELITSISGIPAQVLLTNSGGDISVAQRMSWASRRQTAKVEDKAYCLMGLFGVNMPMAYGEGDNAFRRLQLEIMKLSDDHSIFAWTGDRYGNKRGLLAISPREFEHCAEVRRYGDSSAFSMTNKGLNMKLPLIPHGKSPAGNEIMLGILSCQRKQGSQYPDRYPIAIYLEKEPGGDATNYTRIHPEKTKEIKQNISSYVADKKEIYVRDTDPSRFEVSSWMQPESEYNFYFSIGECSHANTRIEYPENTQMIWTLDKENIKLCFKGSGASATFLFKDKRKKLFAISLGVHNYNVWCAITTDCHNGDLKRIAKDYWSGDKGSARWDNMDRRTLVLSGHDRVDLAIRKGRKDGSRAYFFDIVAGKHFWLESVGPGTGFKDF